MDRSVAEQLLAIAIAAADSLPSDLERRKLLKRRDHESGEGKVIAGVIHRYGGALELGAVLFTDEKVALRRACERLAAHLAAVLDVSVPQLHARFRTAT